MSLQFLTPDELLEEVGARLKAIRISHRIDQVELASRAGISLRALRTLEQGKGSTLETFLRALKGLNAANDLEALVPRPAFNPLTLIDHRRPPQRVRSRKTSKP